MVNTPRAYTFIEDNTHYVYIVQELAVCSLSDILNGKTSKINFTVGEIYRVAISVLSALKLLKVKEIVHRNIRPSSILIFPDGKCKL